MPLSQGPQAQDQDEATLGSAPSRQQVSELEALCSPGCLHTPAPAFAFSLRVFPGMVPGSLCP